MSDNAGTNKVKVYHARQLASGLCRCCPEPLDPKSVQHCAYHLAKQRGYNEGRYMHKKASYKQRRALRAEIGAFAKNNPHLPYRDIAARFSVSITLVANSAKEAGVVRHRRSVTRQAVLMRQAKALLSVGLGNSLHGRQTTTDPGVQGTL